MKTNTKVICGTIAGIMIGGLSVAGANQAIQAMQNNHIRVSLNGQIQEFKDEATGEVQYPITYNNRTYLPLRNIANLVGLSVEYDTESDIALLYDEDYSNTFTKSQKYSLDDLVFDRENLVIDFGENYQDFKYKLWYQENVSDVLTRYITFDHQYLKSNFALTHDENDYISMYGGFNTWGNGSNKQREKVEVTVYDKTGNSKVLKLEQPFLLTTGVNLKYPDSPGIHVKKGDTITIAFDTWNEVKSFKYVIFDPPTELEKSEKYDNEATIINNVAFIPAPDFKQSDDLRINVKVEDIYGNIYYISTMVYNDGV